VGTGNTNSYGDGIVGNAFVFDGLAHDRIDLGNPASFRLQQFTLEAWIKRSSATQISLDDNSGSAGEGGLVISYGYSGYGLGLFNNGKVILSKIGLDGVFSTTVVADTNWHHIAVAKSASNAVFYIDGANVSGPIS